MNSAIVLQSHIYIEVVDDEFNYRCLLKGELMKSMALKSLAICALGAATLVGCASSPASKSVASAQSDLRRGTVADVERTAVIDQTTIQTSSGSSTTVSQASGSSDLATVNFNDGDQKRYLIEEQAAPLKAGQPVSIRPYGDRVLILSP